MKKKNNIWLFSLVLTGIFLLLNFGCKKDEPAAQTPPSIKGSWYGGGGTANFTFNVTNDTDYDWDGAGATMETGTYTIAGSTITLTAKTSFVCSSKTNIKYNYSVSGNKLTFTKVSDSCVFRAGVFAAPFIKQ